MGYLKNKYNKSYFLKEDEQGQPCTFGVEGAELFKQNCSSLRSIDQLVLAPIDFTAKTTLEFGFGRGECLRFAVEKGASAVYGVDFSDDAYGIAKEYLERNGLAANVFCADALNFLTHLDKYIGRNDIKFDLVLMLDFIEHVPRSELTQILSELKKHFSRDGVIVINTPVFAVDNDVISEGLKTEAIDSSDEFEATAGMHCNRYSQESLADYMAQQGFSRVTGHYFVLEQAQEAVSAAQPSIFHVAPENDVYETASRLCDKDVYQPRWFQVQGGILKERWLYLDTKDGLWQKEYIEGTHDKKLFEYLDQRLNLAGKTVFDIGSHIGHHSLCFAQLVGETGKVFSFEPNPDNIDRMKVILSKNPDLAGRIHVSNVAISNTNGHAKFVFSGNIDNGMSSGSFLDGVSTPYDRQAYEEMHFRSMEVETCTLDSIHSRLGRETKVDVVKIDVEGAESLILESANQFLAAHRPLLLMEIHSEDNTQQVLRRLWEVNYRIDLLSFENENRLFIAAYPETAGQVHTPSQFAIADETLKLYFLCVAEKNRQIRAAQDAQRMMEEEKNELEKKRLVLEKEKAVLENELKIMNMRYKKMETFRKTGWGHFIIKVVKLFA